jgi:hypothetical protein
VDSLGQCGDADVAKTAQDTKTDGFSGYYEIPFSPVSRIGRR